MARLLFARIEAWVMILLALVMALGSIAFGYLVLDGSAGAEKYGKLSGAALAVAQIPDTLKDVIHPKDRLEIWNSARFDAKPSGWSAAQATAPDLPGYVLVSRYEGVERRNLLELVSLKDRQVKYSWPVDANRLLGDAAQTSAFMDYSIWNASLFRAIHPIVLPNGDVFLKDHFSPLFRIDACGQPAWKNDANVFHHSTELDADGNIWVPSVIEPHSVKGVPDDFLEDAIAEVDPDGKLLFKKSVTELLIENHLEHLIFSNGTYVYDTTHLNDIQPVLTDGPYWKRGDLFLSLRNISSIMLYRPSTNQLIWHMEGPWLSQHDVDILDDHRIAVYDNHAEDRGKMAKVEDHSRIVTYDFATGAVSTLFDRLMADEKIQTLFAGSFTQLPNGGALIEDTTNARLMVAGPDGSLQAEMVNRASNGKIYQLGWARYVDQALGDQILTAVTAKSCAAP